MKPKIHSFFVIILILFSLIPAQAVAPTKYYEIKNCDTELSGAIFVNVDPSSFYAAYNDGVIQIDSIEHFENVQIKFKGTALNARLKNYNGFNVGYTHIADDGTATHEIKPLEIDIQGFAYLTTDFSTVIINGMIGTTTQTYTSQSSNQSFSVPNGTSYDLNITNNMEGTWTAESDIGGNTSEFEYRVPITLNHSGALSAYQTKLNISMNNSVRFNYGNGTYIPYWNETNDIVWIKNDYLDGNTTIYMYYGNNELNSESDITNFIIINEDFSIDYGELSNTIGHSYTTLEILSGAAHIRRNADWGDGAASFYTKKFNKDTSLKIEFDFRRNSVTIDHGDHTEGVKLFLSSDAETGTRVPIVGNTGGGAVWDLTGTTESMLWKTTDRVLNTWIPITVYLDGNGNYKVGEASWNAIPNYATLTSTINIDLKGTCYGGYGRNDWTEFDNIKVNTFSAIEPTYTIDTSQQAQGETNITASITDDTNTQSYNSTQSREFTLTPIGTTNNVNINTTSTDYDITITIYWTDDTTLQTETATNGYAKQYINYTSNDYNVSADLSTTYVFDFSAQDYTGTATSTLNDVSKPTTRNGQNINASVGELLAGTNYFWNVTVPYNNIFTLSNQTDQTAYLGIPKAFTDSTYNDPDSNPIAARLWNFGDGTDSSSSNPSHTYTTVGNLNANYTVTEDATTNSQTITKEFNVSVEVQPVQDLITEDLSQTWIKFNWSDYTSADRTDVYELEESVPYANETITTDGVKDSAYTDYAHAFVFDTPNPVSDLNYETVYWLRTDDYLHGYADGYDADSKTQDDYFKIGIDILGDGLTVDDRTYELNEGGTVTAARWSGTQWLPQATTAIGVVVGAGSEGALQYEMEIPLSELTGFVNGVTTKFFMERECTNLIPTVESFYPEGVDTDNSSTWGTAQITATDVYNLIGNTTISEYNSTGLTPYTWYKHKFVNVNGTTNSSAVYSTDITIDVPHYTVSGYILDSITGDGIAGANVWAQNGYVDEITQSDANGFYEGYNFHTGNYSIHANVTGYAETYIEINVTGNLTNQNVTMTAFEMTDWMLWEKLLELEESVTPNSTVPITTPPQNAMPLPLFITWFLILFGLVYVAIPRHDEDGDLEETGIKNITASFIAVILAFVLSKIAINGQLVQTFSGMSAINTVVVDTSIIQIGWLSALLTFIGIIMTVVTILLLVEEYKDRYGDADDE